MTRSRVLGVIAGAASLLLVAAPIWAQSDDAEMGADAVEVVGVEYAFQNLPTSVPAGTNLMFTNGGVEVHEMIVNRIADGVDETFEELMVMSESIDLAAEGFIDTDFGDQMLLAAAGETAEGSIAVDREGRYVVLCFIPTGLESAKLEDLGVDLSSLGPETDPADMPAEVQAYLEEVMANPPHVAQGMIQEFLVTAEGTEVGPLPEPAEEAAA